MTSPAGQAQTWVCGYCQQACMMMWEKSCWNCHRPRGPEHFSNATAVKDPLARKSPPSKEKEMIDHSLSESTKKIKKDTADMETILRKLLNQLVHHSAYSLISKGLTWDSTTIMRAHYALRSLLVLFAKKISRPFHTDFIAFTKSH